jgi:aspartyl-tRNA(Asn)/glutamyl-tRNA(Gln) amidotransferase subunit A
LNGLPDRLAREFYTGRAQRRDAQKDHCRDRRAASARREVVEVSLPHTKYGVAVYYIIATAEASANLARFDGVRYGFRHPDAASDVEDVYKLSKSEGFGPEVQRRIMLGTYALSSGYYDAYYLKAQQVRALIRRDFDRAFEQCDFIVTPTTPRPRS